MFIIIVFRLYKIRDAFTHIFSMVFKIPADLLLFFSELNPEPKAETTYSPRIRICYLPVCILNKKVAVPALNHLENPIQVQSTEN